MNNLRTVILLIIIFIIGVSAIYWIYKTQVATDTDELLPLPSPGTGFNDLISPSPSPLIQSNNQAPVPSIQPQSGSDTIEVKNMGIKVTSPNPSSIITSPITINGSANVLNGRVNINIKDASGNILGSGYAIACMGYDACPFETTIKFKSPNTTTGLIEAYNPSSVDGSPKYLQQILIRF